jgi:hypothetical protein
VYCRVPGRGQSAEGGRESEHERENENQSELLVSSLLGGLGAVLGLDLSRQSVPKFFGDYVQSRLGQKCLPGLTVSG